MRLITYLSIPVAGSIVFLWWSLLLFQANRTVELFLASSLVAAVILAIMFIRSSKASGFLFSVVVAIGFCVLWSLLWAGAVEGYIHYFVADGTNENGVGKSRYIYPGHSGMGNADGFLYYLKNLPGILFYGTILGLGSGFLGLLFRILTRNPNNAE